MTDGVRLSTSHERALQGGTMKENMPVLSLEVEEIESRERGSGSCTSSTTSRHCTCACFITTSRVAVLEK
jgi:hypothetical protein